jgi:hypothetical protein
MYRHSGFFAPLTASEALPLSASVDFLTRSSPTIGDAGSDA